MCALLLECTGNANDSFGIFTSILSERSLCIKIIWHSKNNKVDILSWREKKAKGRYLLFVIKSRSCDLEIHFCSFEKRKRNEYTDKHESSYLIGLRDLWVTDINHFKVHKYIWDFKIQLESSIFHLSKVTNEKRTLSPH